MSPDFASGSSGAERRIGRAAEGKAPADRVADWIDQLEEAVSGKSIRRQAEIMRGLTDLFITMTAEPLSVENGKTFDDVMSRLVATIDESVRASFGGRLATVPGAPPMTLRALALDDSIEVARPVLENSDSIDEGVLLEVARSKGQHHLLAISHRRSVDESVTDVLIERGSQPVVASLTSNDGAKFSDHGCAMLESRARNDEEIALNLWSRPDIPRQHLLSLFMSASDEVQRKLVAADRPKADLYRYMVGTATDRMQTIIRENSEYYAAARRHVEDLFRTGQLGEAGLRRFAQARKFDEAAIALSLMCDLPIEHVERALVHDRSDQLLIVAKALDLSWDTTSSILMLRSAYKSMTPQELRLQYECYMKLQSRTARSAMQFYRLRMRSTARAKG